MRNRLSFTFYLFLLVSFSFTPLALTDETKEIKDAAVEITNGTAEVQAATAEIKIRPQTEIKPVAVETNNKTDHGDREVGDVTIHNYGIQAIFINSNVTVNGGTISGELTNNNNATQAKTNEESEETPPRKPTGHPSAPPASKPEKPNKFDETIKDATKEEGLFTVYTKEDKVYWEIKPEQLNKEYLLSGVLATGIGEGWVKPGAYVSDTVISFTKTNGNIQLVERNLRFLSSDPTEQDAVKKNYGESIAATFPTDVTNPETSSCLLEMSKFILTDYFQLSTLLAGYGMDRANSYIEQTQVFPANVVTRIRFAFRSGGRSGAISVPDNRSLQLTLMMDVQELKENHDFTPRLADSRVGHFVEAHIDFADDERNTQFVRYITKWDIRKASPELELSPPVKPIVFWLENTIPEKYRDPIRRGILEWNKAFRKIGVEDPIVVNDQPADADWDVSDIRYNTIHWNTSHNMEYSAVSQWVANPRTGEIFNGGFLIESEDIRGLLNVRRVNEPDRVEMLKNRLSPQLPEDPQKTVCEHGQGLLDHAVYALTVMAAREGIGNISAELKDDFIDQYLFARACHEFGHVLGFRHNFKGSTMLTLDQLHDKAITSEKSIVASVMEYAPVNFAPEGVEQGHYFEPTIGPYDYLAVEYAYKEIKPAASETEQSLLNAIAEQAEMPELVYGTEEDLYSGGGVGLDPLCNTYDLGNDPLAFAKQQAQIAFDTIPKLPNLVREGDNYTMVRLGFNYLLGYYYDSAVFALKYLGGQYFHRVKKGGPLDSLPLEPVSAVKQREALDFITSKIFSDELFEVNADLLNMLAAEKWNHWGSRGSGISTDYSLVNVVSNLYDIILYQLYSPTTIRRILDAESRRRSEAVNFTVPELFETLNEGIWAEVYAANREAIANNTYSNRKPFLSTYRRTLQRQHLKRLIEIMLEPPYGMPEDARTQAWRSLRKLEKDIGLIVEQCEDKDILDDYSFDHLAESQAKIRRALDARLSVRVDFN